MLMHEYVKVAGVAVSACLWPALNASSFWFTSLYSGLICSLNISASIKGNMVSNGATPEHWRDPHGKCSFVWHPMAVWCSEKTLFVFVTLFSIKFVQRASVADRWCPHYLGNIVQPLDCLYRLYIKPKTTQNRHFRPSHFWHKSARVCSTRDGPRRKSSGSRTFCNHVSHAEWYKGSHQMPIYRNFNVKRVVGSPDCSVSSTSKLLPDPVHQVRSIPGQN